MTRWRSDGAGYANGFSTSDKTIKVNLAFVKSFQERLAEAISLARKPKSELARHLGVPQSSVSRWLAGSEPRSETLAEIAKFLSVDVKWLAYGDEPAQSTSLQDNVGNPQSDLVNSAQQFAAGVQSMMLEMAEMRQRLAELEEIVRKGPQP